MAPTLSVTLMETDVELADVEVPETTPVVEFRLNPEGSEPLASPHVYGATPPVAARLTE